MLLVRGVIGAGQDILDTGIRDLELVHLTGGWAVYTVTGPKGGIVEYRLSDGAAARVAGTTYFPTSFPDGTGGFGAVTSVSGQTSLVVGNDGQMPLVRYALDPASGALGQPTQSGLPGLGHPLGAVGAAAGGDSLLFVADGASGDVQAFSLTPGQAAGGAVVPGGHTGAGDTPIMAAMHTAGADMLMVASPTGNSITDYSIGPQGGSLTRLASLGAADGLGINAPSAMATVDAPDGAYLLVAASGSSSISVLSVGPGGALGVTDHVIDTLNTRFQHVQSLSTVSVGDREFVVAGGSDGGVTLFTLLPGGRLMTLDTSVQTADLGLGKVQALTAAHVGQEVQVLAAAQDGHGLTQLAFSVADLGQTLIGTAGADTLQGQAKDDVLAGGAGTDHLFGGAGSDILYDGSGSDTMTGGAGADTFVLAGDGAQDVITDFQPGVDRLDLSGLYLFSDPARLSVTQTTDGAVVDWFGDRLVLTREDGGPITRAEVLAAVIPSADHPYLGDLATAHAAVAQPVPHGIEGTAGADTVMGQAGAELINALGGNDLIDGGGGADTINAGAGADTVIGGSRSEMVQLGAGNDLFQGSGGNLGNDTVMGGDGADVIKTGDGNDHVFGNTLADTIFSGGGADTVNGGLGRDLVHMGAGNDIYFDCSQGGVLGRDTVFAEAGADTIQGGNGDDAFYGGDGNDRIFGRLGNDRLFGNTGFDTIYAGAGADTVNGGLGRDLVHMGTGNDIYFDCSQGGVLGRDTVFADAGADTIQGGNGDDAFYGGDGNDRIFGRLGNDRLFGNTGFDTIYAGDGADTVNGGLGRDLVHMGTGNDIYFDCSQGGVLGRDTVFAEAGADTIQGGNGDDAFYGGTGNDSIIARLGNDLLVGGAGADQLFGGAGNDRLVGGPGQDSLWGGAGADTFVFGPTAGKDIIYGFNPAEDRIAIQSAAKGMADLTIHDHGGDAVIDYSGGSITLHGVGVAQIDAGDFLFS